MGAAMTMAPSGVNAVAAEAASLPGADPTALGRIRDLAREIGREYSRTDGMDLSLVRAGAAALHGGRGRGGIGQGVGQFLRDVFLKASSDTAGGWLYDVGIAPDEESRDAAEGQHADNTHQLCRALEECCQAIDEVDSTADQAISALLATISGLLVICKIHPLGRVVGLILPLVVSGMEQIRDVVVDRNDQVSGCWQKMNDSCGAVLEHQPQAARTWQCPELASPAETVSCPDEVAQPAPPAGEQCAREASGGGSAAPGGPAAQAHAAGDGKECRETADAAVPSISASSTGTVAASVGGAMSSGATPISFNVHLDAGSEAGPGSCAPQDVSCADVAQFGSSTDAGASTQACLIGPLAAVGIGITLECLGYLADSLAEAAQCPGEACVEHAQPAVASENPPVHPTSEDCPPAAGPPEAEPPAQPPTGDQPPPQQPPLDEGTIAPPAELGEVEQPSMPAEKLRAAGLETAPVEVDEPDYLEEPVAEQVEPAPVPQPAPAPENGPGETGSKMRKSGEW